MKVAISVPASLFSSAELLARQLKISRNQLYVRALTAYLDAGGSALITAQLNVIYGAKSSGVDPSLALAQSQSLLDEAW